MDKSLTVRLPGHVYEEAQDLAKVTDASMKDLVVSGLRRELDVRIDQGGEKLRTAMESLKAFRVQEP